MDRYDDRTPLWDYSDNRAPDDQPRGRWDSARRRGGANLCRGERQRTIALRQSRTRRALWRSLFAKKLFARRWANPLATAGNYGRVPFRDDSQAPAYSGYREPRGDYRQSLAFVTIAVQDERYAEDRGMQFWPSEFGFPPIGYSLMATMGAPGRRASG